MRAWPCRAQADGTTHVSLGAQLSDQTPGRERDEEAVGVRVLEALASPAGARGRWPLNVIQRQLGHPNLGVTSIYLQGIDPDEIIETVHRRRQPMIPASAGLALPFRG
jgi:hypothetical protein